MPSVPSSLVAAYTVPYVPKTRATTESSMDRETPSTKRTAEVTSASPSSSCHSVRRAISASIGTPRAARDATALDASRSAANSTSAIVEEGPMAGDVRGSTETHPAHISRRDSSGVVAGATRTHFSPPSSSSSSCFASSFAAGAGGGGGTSRTGGGGTSRTGSGATSGAAASGSAAGAGAGSSAGAATSAPSSPSVFATCSSSRSRSVGLVPSVARPASSSSALISATFSALRAAAVSGILPIGAQPVVAIEVLL
mmetsp:Transcript_5532/g.22613  ORF Transcript_5532/g.22613 Transcript_5532/m.22613 type:complete len:255 (-) Transcript_5532:6-770(-)